MRKIILLLGFGITIAVLSTPFIATERINAMASYKFDENFCWLKRHRGNKGGGISVSHKRRYDAPVFANIWDNIFPYWRVGQRPMYFGIVHIPSSNDIPQVYGWSYSEFGFYEFDLPITSLPDKIRVCREIIRLRKKYGVDEFEERLSDSFLN